MKEALLPAKSHDLKLKTRQRFLKEIEVMDVDGCVFEDLGLLFA